MMIEILPDEQRLLIITLVTRSLVDIRDDPAMANATRECTEIIKRLSGTDTRVMLERAYPSGV